MLDVWCWMFCRCSLPERGSVSRSGTAGTTGIRLPDTLLAGEHAAGRRPALLSLPAALGCGIRQETTSLAVPFQLYLTASRPRELCMPTDDDVMAGLKKEKKPRCSLSR